eukprot:3381165-Prymnesium_polylepis.1
MSLDLEPRRRPKSNEMSDSLPSDAAPRSARRMRRCAGSRRVRRWACARPPAGASGGWLTGVILNHLGDA